MLNQHLLGDDKESSKIMKNYEQYYYDMRNFEVNNISMKNWDTIESDHSESSFLWENSSCFKPPFFFKNTQRKPEFCHDSVYVTLFLLNIFVLIGLSIYYYDQKQEMLEKLKYSKNYKGFSEFYNREIYPHFENDITWVFLESFFFSFFINFIFFSFMILYNNFFYYFYYFFLIIL